MSTYQISIALLVDSLQVSVLSSLFAALLCALCYCVQQTMGQYVVSLLFHLWAQLGAC